MVEVQEYAVIVQQIIQNGGIRAIALNDSSMLTCLSNDYSYEEVFSKQIGYYGFKDDMLIAISSSGMSQNILNAVNYANKMGIYTITLSGFKSDNDLRKLEIKLLCRFK